PSLSVNRFGDVLVGYSSFSTNQYPSANYSFRAFFDPLGQLRNPRTFKSGEGVFFVTGYHFGDYSATVVDPLNDADLWTIQEWAETNRVIDEVLLSGYGVQWSLVTVAVPPNDNLSAALVLSGSQGSTNGMNIRATGELAEPRHGGNSNT